MLSGHTWSPAFASIPSLSMNVALGRFEVSKCFPFCRWEDDLVLPGFLMISVSIDYVQYPNQEASLGQLFRVSFSWNVVYSLVVHMPFFILQFSSVQSLSRIWLFETPWTAARRASLYSYQGLKKKQKTRMNTFLCVLPASGLLIFWCWVTFAVSAYFIFSLLVASVTWALLLCALWLTQRC